MPERRITAGPAEQGNKLKKKKKEMTRKKKKKKEKNREKEYIEFTVFAYSFEQETEIRTL